MGYAHFTKTPLVVCFWLCTCFFICYISIKVYLKLVIKFKFLITSFKFRTKSLKIAFCYPINFTKIIEELEMTKMAWRNKKRKTQNIEEIFILVLLELWNSKKKNEEWEQEAGKGEESLYLLLYRYVQKRKPKQLKIILKLLLIVTTIYSLLSIIKELSYIFYVTYLN